ncbi:MAG: hypothetical protein KDJ28_10335 [Candidatus Competibacteraceae bacterium]|nr:hypothetical protein [Candidatus Competibacteraceae bacterium]
MKFAIKDPPRHFTVGHSVKFEIKDCGSLALEADEQITFTTESGAEYDVARKNWGFYATPSLNGRLQSFGLRGVLIRNRLTSRYFVLLVERERESDCERYLEQESCDVVAWLDSTETLDQLRVAVSSL